VYLAALPKEPATQPSAPRPHLPRQELGKPLDELSLQAAELRRTIRKAEEELKVYEDYIRMLERELREKLEELQMYGGTKGEIRSCARSM
jgi:chromosome segregation ATPase